MATLSHLPLPSLSPPSVQPLAPTPQPPASPGFQPSYTGAQTNLLGHDFHEGSPHDQCQDTLRTVLAGRGPSLSMQLSLPRIHHGKNPVGPVWLFTTTFLPHSEGNRLQRHLRKLPTSHKPQLLPPMSPRFPPPSRPGYSTVNLIPRPRRNWGSEGVSRFPKPQG